MKFHIFLALSMILGTQICRGDDWPTYMYSPDRSGVCSNALDLPLSEQWIYQAKLPPQPAWPPPAKRDYFHSRAPKALVTYDRAFHLIAVKGRVYFGSSADDAIHCIDQSTGRESWAYQTEGPVRLAPSYANGRIFFGSDDGCLYAVNATTGKLAWKTRPVTPDVRLPGNQRIISLYPIRSGILIDGDGGHFCAGIFPKQGVYHGIVDLKSGRIIGTKQIQICAEGYLSKHDERLFTPTGRIHKGAFFNKLDMRAIPLGKKTKVPRNFVSGTIRNNRFVIRGGDNTVAVSDAASGKEVWRATVQGNAQSIIISNNTLLVSTDRGVIHAFSKAPKPRRTVAKDATMKPRLSQTALKHAAKLVELAGTAKGYCLVIGADSTPARAMVATSDYNVILRMSDANAVTKARAEIAAAGLTKRIRVHRGSASKLPYVSYMFNVVVSTTAANSTELWRVTRPEGGVLSLNGSTKRRGKLKDSGEWTHFYGDTGNTGASDDRTVGKKLQMQWFGEPGPEHMVDRHNRAMPSLYKDGRMFVPGNNWFAAVDAYNGTILWQREVPNSVRATAFKSAGNAVVNSEYLFIAAGNKCRLLDPATGDTAGEIPTPNSSDDWCYVATTNGIVYGSDTPTEALRWKFHKTSWAIGYSPNTAIICSRSIFAYDLATRKLRSRYKPKAGIILTPTIAIDNDAIFFLESTSPGIIQAFNKHKGHLSLQSKQKDPGLTSRLHLVALNAQTLKIKWRKPVQDVKAQNCLFLTATNQKLLIYGSRVTDKILYGIRCVSQSNGQELWSAELAPAAKDKKGSHGELMQHGVVANGTFYLYNAAFPLNSGKRITSWNWRRQAHGCGVFSASQVHLFWRGANPRFAPFDNRFAGNVICAVNRPGCWIGIIPAGGLVLIPESSSGCTCAYPIQCSMAFRFE